MSFPASPSNGQYAVVNNIGYSYNSTTNAWTRAGTTGTTILVTSATFINGGATGSIPYQIAAGQTGFIGIATTSGWVLTSNGTTSSFAPATGGGGTSIAMVNNTTTSALQYITFASTSTGTLSTLQTAIPGTAGPGLTFQPTTGYVGIGTATNLTSALYITAPPGAAYGPKITLDSFLGQATGIDMQINYGSIFGYSTSTIAFDFYGAQFGPNSAPGPGPGRGPGSHGLNLVSGRNGLANFWFRDYNYNVLASIVNNGTFVTGYNFQSYTAPSYSGLFQGQVAVGTSVTNATLTVAGTAIISGIFSATSGVTASTTQTGAIVVQGGIGVGGGVYANQITAANLFAGAASTNIDSRAVNGTWSVNLLARTAAGAYNPLVQQDDSLIYFSNGSQGFGNLVIAPWSNTSTGIRITNTGSIFIPSTNIATTPTSAALVVSGGMYAGGLSWINGGSDTQYRAAGLTVSANINSNYTIGADPGDSNRTLSLIATTASRPIVLTFRNTQNNAASMWDFVSDPNTSKFYIQPTLSGYYAMSLSTTGTVFINSSSVAISTTTGALQVAGGVGIGGALFVGGTSTFSSPVIINGTSITISNGIVGVGQSGTINLGDGTFTKTYGGSWTFGGGVASTGAGFTAPTGPNYYQGYQFAGQGTAIVSSSTNHINFIVNNSTVTDLSQTTFAILTTTQATSTSSGALVVAGGVGIGGNLYVGSTSSVAYLRVNNPTQAGVGQYSAFKGESWFYTSSFTDPDSGVLRSMKIGDSGLAVTGGIKSDNFTATNNIYANGTIYMQGVWAVSTGSASSSAPLATPTSTGTVFGYTTGNGNTAIGCCAGNTSMTGANNIAIGCLALYQNQTGASNVAIGYQAMCAINIGSRNVAVGQGALAASATGVDNVAIGYSAACSTTFGSGNVALGSCTLRNNTTGQNNFAAGLGALNANTTGANNVAIGASALLNNTTGVNNFAAGCCTLLTNTGGSYNTAIGFCALQNNTYGCQNTAIGTSALRSNITGPNNVAIGACSLFSNTSGPNNVAIGYLSLYCNTIGCNNYAIGCYALVCNSAGNNNFAVGAAALCSNSTGVNNVAIGFNALCANTTGCNNTAIGCNALALNCTGTGNVAIGYGALKSNTSGCNNIAIGNCCTLSGNTTGVSNIALGERAMYSNSSGSYNIGIGCVALGANTTGSNNVAIGYGAVRNNTYGNYNIGIGVYALLANITGGNNTALGASALKCNTTGSNNFAVGYGALRCNLGGSNNTAIGNGTLRANTTGNHNIGIGLSNLTGNTYGSCNIALGYYALTQNITGNNNIALGYGTLYCNTVGSNNFAAGWCSMVWSVTGNSNIGIGCKTLSYNTGGSYNIALGASSLNQNITGCNNIAIGQSALTQQTSGNCNIAIGPLAGCAITTGVGNVIIGAYSGVDIATNTGTVVIADGNGSVKMGFTSTGALFLGSTLTNFGVAGQALVSNGPNSAPNWGNVTSTLTTSSINISETTVVASTNTFIVPGGYIPGQIQVFANGIQLGSADYNGATSPTIVTNRYRNPGDVMRFVSNTSTFYSPTNYAFSVQEITATSNGQTIFTVPGGYSVGNTQVFLNGIALESANYTASNGSFIILASGNGVIVGSILRTVSFTNFNLIGALPLSGGTINGAVNVIGALKQNGATIQAVSAAMSVALGM